MAKTVIYLVRHGESLGNFRRTLLGHTDLDLSDLGFCQAEQCAKALSHIKFDKIYSSDLKRALSTAAPHAKLRNTPVIPSENLREIYLGEWENRTIDYVKENYSELYEENWKKDFFNFTPPRGEAVPHLGERIRAKLTEIATSNPDNTILVTFHAAAIRSFWATIHTFMTDNPCLELPFPTNASYSIVEYENGSFTPISYSVDGHIS